MCPNVTEMFMFKCLRSNDKHHHNFFVLNILKIIYPNVSTNFIHPNCLKKNYMSNCLKIIYMSKCSKKLFISNVSKKLFILNVSKNYLSQMS